MLGLVSFEESLLSGAEYVKRLVVISALESPVSTTQEAKAGDHLSPLAL